jgi:hypothetical protein
MKEYEQKADIIRQEIEVMKSKAAQQVTILNSEATAQAYYITQLAEASGRTIQLETESEVYGSAIQLLALSEDEMAEFLYLQSILDAKDATVVFGLDKAMVQLN